MANLTTLQSVKLYLGEASPSTVNDPVLEALIPAVSAWFERETGRALASAGYTTTFDGNGRSRILLPEYPVTAVTSVKVGSTTIPQRTSVDGDGWVLSDASIGELALVGYEFTEGVQNVEVQFTAGFSPVPADIAQAVNELVALKFRERAHVGTASQGVAGVSVSFLPALIPASVRTVIDHYARRSV